MRSKWARAFLWSTFGGFAVGAAAVLAGTRRRKQPPVLRCQRIPEGCSGIVLWTEAFQVQDADGTCTCHDTYILQVTPFKAWSVLELSSEPGCEGPEGSTIFHITHMRARDTVGSLATVDSVLDRYYGTISLIDPNGESCGRNRLARGGVLQVAECLVGGSANGIETGNVRQSAAPILNYRFEYTPSGTQFREPPAKAS
jgi:hypothetical protein